MSAWKAENAQRPASTRVAPTTWLMIHWRFVLFAILVPIALIVLGVSLLAWNAVPERTLRIGYRDAPPDHFRDALGDPSGPAVEVITEAARRKNMRLQWVYSPEGPEKALSGGEIDLW